MLLTNDLIESTKRAFAKALQEIPEFCKLGILKKGDVIDKNFKSLMRDLMNQFGLKPGIDYEDELRDKEPASDFVIKSKEANDLIQDLLNGRIVVRKEHTRISKHGNQYTVNAHFVKVSGK
ncbi:hypothetical protein ACEYW6_01110 [Nostoc sp. UIC 10607]|uniref:hypothetical protein n=1 Tax=Nostoc sp. UIC 10607 TaxID=3045935 RepID=UPI00399F1E00